MKQKEWNDKHYYPDSRVNQTSASDIKQASVLIFKNINKQFYETFIMEWSTQVSQMQIEANIGEQIQTTFCSTYFKNINK